MRIGFGRNDLTPRVGVELAGFGAYINRHSVGARDRLWARAMAFEAGGEPAVIVSNDLCVIYRTTTERVCELVSEATGVSPERVMVTCTHTHSGPETGGLIGWGQPDQPYIELLPDRIAKAAIAAVEDLRTATLAHAKVACEGIGHNREYGGQRPSLEEALRDDWRPERPELTDRTAHVLVAHDGSRDMIGFASSFGCHPVVCCAQTRWIHGDFCGVATNLIEREHPGATGLFLQGAQGDVNTCVVHEPEQESLLALDVIAARYARSVRRGIEEAQPLEVDRVDVVRREVEFSRREFSRSDFVDLLAEQEAIIHAPGASDADREMRLATVKAVAYRRFIDALDEGRPLVKPTVIQGLRIGPLGLYASPFEVFQAIKNDVAEAALAPIPLVLGVANDALGYAPDHEAAARGGYAADQVPLMQGTLPFASIHHELVEALLALDAELFGA
ncbi:MAG: neutral/alkaline non-lysosomal ceramidase N-terminal domain-containing protein [Armatimonadota bacterium]